MKTNRLFIVIISSILVFACSSSVEFSEKFKQETSGKYLFNADDVMEISYKDNDLFLTWRGMTTKPVATDTNEFFIPDLYKKMRFVINPADNERYLSEIHENNPDSLSYDYLKVADDYKTPSQYIEAKQFDKALVGLQAIKAQDSVSDYVNQYKFNRIGYKYIKDDNYKDAIAIFEMNTKLHPNKSNTWDSLAAAYLKNSDSLQAYESYKKTLSLNNNNRRAQTYVNAYEEK